MLQRYLPLGPEGLTYATIQQLVDALLPESENLELKLIRPNNNLRVARRIAAMANNGGGLLLIGVPDEKHEQRDLKPVRLDQEEMTVRQIINSIEPPIVARLHRVPSPDDLLTGILAVEIPTPSRLPVTVRDNEHTYFEIRSGTTTRPLSEREVERFYRARFQRLEEVEARMERLSASVPRMAGSVPFKHAYVGIVPLFPVDRLFQLSRRELGAMQQLLEPELMEYGFQRFPHVRNQQELFTQLSQLGYFGRNVTLKSKPGFKRMEFTQAVFEESYLRERGWFELHDDGAMFAILPADTIDGAEQLEGWNDVYLVLEVVRVLATYAVFAAAYHLNGELEIRLGISESSEHWLMPSTYERTQRFAVHSSGQPFSTTYNVDVEMLTPAPRLLRTAKYLLDDFFTAFGWHECDMITTDGILVPRTFPRDEWPRRFAWLAEQLGIAPAVSE